MEHDGVYTVTALADDHDRRGRSATSATLGPEDFTLHGPKPGDDAGTARRSDTGSRSPAT